MPHKKAEHADLLQNRASLTRFAWLSIGAALATITLKSIAYILTGSVGLLSDAIESFVNLVGAIMALAMLTIAAIPPDQSHMYGHGKAEYFSSTLEGDPDPRRLCGNHNYQHSHAFFIPARWKDWVSGWRFPQLPP